jgi:hypothetical protein
MGWPSFGYFKRRVGEITVCHTSRALRQSAARTP